MNGAICTCAGVHRLIAGAAPFLARPSHDFPFDAIEKADRLRAIERTTALLTVMQDSRDRHGNRA